ncbi:MAG: thiol:disulfide interchange protein DsbA/DsbL [Glaciimonas sp.]|nr:thiol:disulfide interchange protein DsbA/DsbL [Glaciimonas sp.]
MRFFKHAFAIAGLSLGLVAVSASASPTNPVAGKEYTVLQTPQTTTATGNKVEITEFFGYFCPHCSALDPSLEKWIAAQGDKIVVKRIPVAFGPQPAYVAQQKLYFTLEGLNLVSTLHPKVFEAMHGSARLRLDNEKDITAWAVKQGVDAKKFADMYNSFGVASKATAATKAQNDYKIDGVPTLAVDGRFITSPSIVGATMAGAKEPELFAATLQTMDSLIAKVAAEKAKTAAPAAVTPAKKK